MYAPQAIDYILRLVTASDALLSLEDAKEHLRVDFDDEDAYIASLVAAAQDLIDGPDGMVGKAIASQTWRYGIKRPLARVHLPVVPVQSVTSMAYYDEANTEQALDLSDFTFLASEDVAYIEPKSGVSWPAMYDRADALNITFLAGFGAVSDAPQALVHALKLMIYHWYENRQDVEATQMHHIPLGAQALINRYRIGWIK